MGIYEEMQKNWGVYCLMSSIAYIEEMSKPLRDLQIKTYKESVYSCLCFRSIRLKMKTSEFIDKFFKITKFWEKDKNLKLIGETFNSPRKENFSGQYMFLLTPPWLNLILQKCGSMPNKYSYNAAIDRMNNFVQYKKRAIPNNKNLFDLLFKNKNLAAGAFVVSMDLEFRGVQQGRPSLCMSKRYGDFLEFMLKVAKRWGWTNNKELSPVKMDYSKNLGINASPQYEFRINTRGLKEIYNLAGPLCDPHKDRCLKFHINRSENYKNRGRKCIPNDTKQKILNIIKTNKDMTTTRIQFKVNIGVDVILDHLHNLEKEGLVIKNRAGKRYIWNYNGN